MSKYSDASSNLIYYIHLPNTASPTKLVPAAVLLHGWEGDETVMKFFDQTIPAHMAIVRPRAPLTLASKGFGWFDTSDIPQEQKLSARRTSVGVLTQFLKSLPLRYPIDGTKIILIGFSQGAIMANYVALSQPSMVIGIASLAGRILDEEPFVAQCASLDDFPVFIAHGTTDDVIAVDYARRAREVYTQLNAKVTYGEYAIGHKMNTQAVKDLTMWVAKTMPSPVSGDRAR